MSKILLTVPHATCDGLVKDHLCDYAALEFANHLKAELTKKGFNVILIIGDLPRTQCDLNREQCSQTKFVGEVNVVLNQGVDLHLDIHSYPQRMKNWNKYDGMFLVQNWNMLPIIDDLIQSLATNNVKTSREVGIKNYLISLSESLEIPSWLIEIRESGNITTKIASLLANWIDSRFTSDSDL